MEQKQKKLYKILINNKSCHGGDIKWKLKQWTPRIDDVEICKRGYHLTTKPYEWYKDGCDIFEAEAQDIIAWQEDKCVCKSARIIKKIEKPEWLKKTERFISSLPKFKFGKQDGKVLKEWKYFEAGKLDAAGDAAWDAAGDAAWDAAGDAAGNAARNAAWDAAWDATRDAVRDAAGDAAGDAARDAAGDATLYARFLIISDLINKNEKLRQHWLHVQKRWEVYQKGYWLKCDVNGVLYVYGVKK